MFAQLGTWLATFTSGYVAHVVGDLSAALAVIALIWLTVYIANYGFAVVRGEVQEPMSVFGWKMIKMAFILGIALSGSLYMSVVFSTADGLQDSMATVFLAGGDFDQGRTYPFTDDNQVRLPDQFCIGHTCPHGVCRFSSERDHQ